jgi:protease I
MEKVAILVEDYYQVLEVWYPYLRLREAGIETVLVGTEKREYKSKEGYPAEADVSVKDIKAKDFSGVVIPGGWAPDILRRFKEINKLVKDIFIQGKLVASICHGGWVLVSAGILKGKKATSFYAIKDDLINAGAEFLDKEVVVDGNLITSRNPYDLGAFCREIIGFLNKEHSK